MIKSKPRGQNFRQPFEVHGVTFQQATWPGNRSGSWSVLNRWSGKSGESSVEKRPAVLQHPSSEPELKWNWFSEKPQNLLHGCRHWRSQSSGHSAGQFCSQSWTLLQMRHHRAFARLSIWESFGLVAISLAVAFHLSSLLIVCLRLLLRRLLLDELLGWWE